MAAPCCERQDVGREPGAALLKEGARILMSVICTRVHRCACVSPGEDHEASRQARNRPACAPPCLRRRRHGRRTGRRRGGAGRSQARPRQRSPRRRRTMPKRAATSSPRTCSATTRPPRSDRARRELGTAPTPVPARYSHAADPQVRHPGDVSPRRAWCPAWRAASRARCRRWTAAPSCAVPAWAWRRHRRLAADAGEEGRCRRPAAGTAVRAKQGRGQAHRLRPLLGGLRDRRGGRERRLGAPGAGVRQPDQPGRALRQGRGAARARPRRVPPEVPDEAGRRQVPAHQLGRGAERDQRQDARAAQGTAAPTRSSSSARPSTTTSRPTCCASGCRSGAATTPTTRRASATPPRWPAWPTPGATAR